MFCDLTTDQRISLCSACISFAGLLFVGFQIQQNTRQSKLASLYQIYDVNRQLLSLGFDHPKLFEIMADSKNADPLTERRYLQLWLNQLSLIYMGVKHYAFHSEFKQSLENEIRDFMALENARKYWLQNGTFFAPSFQKFINKVLAETASALPDQTGNQEPKT